MLTRKRARLCALAEAQSSALINQLPDEVLVHVFKRATLVDLLRCEMVSKRFRQVIRRHLDSLKKPINLTIEYKKSPSTYRYFSTFVLELSSGQPKRARMEKLSIRNAMDKVSVNNQGAFTDTLHILQRSGFTAFWTRCKAQKFFLYLFKKLVRYCDVSKIRVRENWREHFVGPLRVFTDVKIVEWLQSPGSRNLKELQRLPKMTRLCIDSNISIVKNFDFRPFPALQELKVVASTLGGFNSTLDDAALLEERRMKVLLLNSVRVQVSLRGIRAVLDEWREGKREIDRLLIQPMDLSNFTTAQALDVLHDCSRVCKGGQHFITRQAGEGQLKLNITTRHVGATNVKWEDAHFTDRESETDSSGSSDSSFDSNDDDSEDGFGFGFGFDGYSDFEDFDDLFGYEDDFY